VRRVPTQVPARTIPISESDSPKCVRTAGASAGSPIPIAEKLACAAVPPARTTQRYG